MDAGRCGKMVLGRETAKEQSECGKPCWEVICQHRTGQNQVLGTPTASISFIHSNIDWPPPRARPCRRKHCISLPSFLRALGSTPGPHSSTQPKSLRPQGKLGLNQLRPLSHLRLLATKPLILTVRGPRPTST